MTHESALAMIALQRSEIQRLRAEIAKARRPVPPAEYRRRLLRAQEQTSKQKTRAELWRHRAMRAS